MLFFKKSVIFYSINWPSFIVWLPLLREGFTIVYFLGYDVINFEINLIIQIEPFSYMTKMSRQNFKYFENDKSF